MSMIYLSGYHSPNVHAQLAAHDRLGLMIQPRTRSYFNHSDEIGPWAFDNDCFKQGPKFDAQRWFRHVVELPGQALFVSAPDVVGDAVATWKRSAPWLGRIRRANQRAALVFQDGIEDTAIQWGGFDAAFIGGSDEFKLSDTVVELIAAAKAHNKWVHVGRVNSARRFRHFEEAGADSADGTFLNFGKGRGTENLPRLLSWVGGAAA